MFSLLLLHQLIDNFFLKYPVRLHFLSILTKAGAKQNIVDLGKPVFFFFLNI